MVGLNGPLGRIVVQAYVRQSRSRQQTWGEWAHGLQFFASDHLERHARVELLQTLAFPNRRVNAIPGENTNLFSARPVCVNMAVGMPYYG
eukprot:3714886-Pyramimonas_sp.AAC.1